MDKFINYLHIWATNLTAEDFYVFGVILGSILATIGVTAWIKRSYLRRNAKKLASEFIVLNVTFWGFLTTVASFVLTQGPTFVHLAPWLAQHWAQISGGAIAIHAVATALKKWYQDRKDNKPLTVPEVSLPTATHDTPQQDPAVPKVTSDIWR